VISNIALEALSDKPSEGAAKTIIDITTFIL
jgi:hypothetical protein